MVHHWTGSFSQTELPAIERWLESISEICDSQNLSVVGASDDHYQLGYTREEFDELACQLFSTSLIQELKAQQQFPLSDSKWRAVSAKVVVRKIEYRSIDCKAELVVRVSFEGGIPCFGFSVFALKEPQFPTGFVDITCADAELLNDLKHQILQGKESMQG